MNSPGDEEQNKRLRIEKTWKFEKIQLAQLRSECKMIIAKIEVYISKLRLKRKGLQHREASGHYPQGADHCCPSYVPLVPGLPQVSQTQS